MTADARRGLSVFRSRRMAIVFVLGFSSGLPLLLSAGTLKQWLYDGHVDNKSIAALVSAGLPYTFKVAWAPLLDRYRLPFLGRRRGWILVFQLALVGVLLATSTLDPHDASAAWWFAFLIAFASASQDIVIDAYNTDLLEPEERAAGTATYVMGYRVAMLIAGSFALVLADHIVWRAIYIGMAALMGVGIIGTLLAEEPPLRDRPPKTLVSAFVVPLAELWKRLRWRLLLVFAFAATYKFGDQFAQNMTDIFYRELHYTKTDIGLVNKAVGFAAFAVGGVVAGALVARHGVRKMLVVFGLVQATVHLGYLWIAAVGKDVVIYGVAIFIENVGFALGTTALTAAIMGVCNPAVSATQMALMTSLTSLGSRVFGGYGADVQGALGWTGFFLTTMAMAIPGIILAWLAADLTTRKTT